MPVVRAAGSSLPADTFALGDLLTKVSHLVAIKYVDNAGDLKSIGLDPPHIKDAEMAVRAVSEVILIGKPNAADKVTPVMRQEGQADVMVNSRTRRHPASISPRQDSRSVECRSGARNRHHGCGGDQGA